MACLCESWHNGRITLFRPSLFALAVLVSLVASCELSLEGRPCPCSAGYNCCYAEWVCRKKEEGCPSPPLAVGPVPMSTTNDDQSIQADGLVGNSITALASVSDTELWVGTECSGLYTLRGRWDMDAQIDRRYQAQNSILPDNGIRALHTDPQGAIWAITRSGYLYAFDGMRWTIFGGPGFIKEILSGKSQKVVAFSPDKSVWLLHGGMGTLWQMVDGVLTGTGVEAPPNVDAPSDPKKKTKTNAIAFDASGVLFAATSRGPAILDGKMLVPIGPEAMQGVAVNDISYSKEWGQMLFATDAGLWTRDSANQWRELELTPGATASPKPSLGAPVRTVSSAAGRIVAILDATAKRDAVALGRAATMNQINFNAKVNTVGFLPDQKHGALALLAVTKGAPPRIERTDEAGWVGFEKLLQASETALPWQVENLARLKRRTGQVTTIAELVAHPKAYSGNFVTVQARTVDVAGYRLTDDKGNILPFSVHEAFGRFIKTRGIPLSKSEGNFILSGYFEAGGCYLYNSPYFFYVTDYFPAAWPEKQTNALYEQLDTLCTSGATACCCEWIKPDPYSDDNNPRACPGNPCL